MSPEQVDALMRADYERSRSWSHRMRVRLLEDFMPGTPVHAAAGRVFEILAVAHYHAGCRGSMVETITDEHGFMYQIPIRYLELA